MLTIHKSFTAVINDGVNGRGIGGIPRALVNYKLKRKKINLDSSRQFNNLKKTTKLSSL